MEKFDVFCFFCWVVLERFLEVVFLYIDDSYTSMFFAGLISAVLVVKFWKVFRPREVEVMP